MEEQEVFREGYAQVYEKGEGTKGGACCVHNSYEQAWQEQKRGEGWGSTQFY